MQVLAGIVTEQGFIYWGVQGGISPPKPSILSPKAIHEFKARFFLLPAVCAHNAINPKVVRITCIASTKYLQSGWSIKGVLPPPLEETLLTHTYIWQSEVENEH